MTTLNRRHMMGTLTSLLMSHPLAQAQGSDKALSLTVAWPVGGPVDSTARVLQPELSLLAAQPVVVENVPGAGGVIGLERYVARAPAVRGLLLGSNSEMIGSLLTTANVKIKPEDFRLLAIAGLGGFLVLARESLPVKSFDELVAFGKTQPANTLKFGHFGVGSLFHVAWEELSAKVGISALQVPYKGAPDLLRDLGAGDLDIAFVPLNQTTFNFPRVRVLGTTSPARNPYFATLPALNESTTARGFRYEGWYALAVTRDTPTAEFERLQRWVQSAVGAAGYAQSSMRMGVVVPPAQSRSELDNFYQAEIERYRIQLKRLGLLA